jgi:integrase/recombinase XerD
MLDALFQRPHHIRRIRANPLGATLDQLVRYLSRRGHRACVVHQFLRSAEHYGYWLGTCHAPVTQCHVTKVSARQFLREHLVACSCPAPFPRSLVTSRAAVNHLLRMLDQQDPARLVLPPTPHDALLADYDRFLRRTCGLSEHTRLYRLRYARQFLDRQFGDDSPVPERLKAIEAHGTKAVVGDFGLPGGTWCRRALRCQATLILTPFDLNKTPQSSGLCEFDGHGALP